MTFKQRDDKRQRIKPSEEEKEASDWLLLGDRQLQSSRDIIFNLGQKSAAFIALCSSGVTSAVTQPDVFESLTVDKQTSPCAPTYDVVYRRSGGLFIRCDRRR